MRWGAWIARAAAASAAVLVFVVAAAWMLARPAKPDAFYTPPVAPPRGAGVLLRSEPLGRGTPPGAKAWRILYATTAGDGAPAVASAVVMTAEGGAQAPRPVIAWAHGTTGVAPGCAPSMAADPYRSAAAAAAIVSEHWVYVGADYIGLGVGGAGHAYLVGADAGHAVLDAVRAARQIKGLAAAEQTVVWGHSQGGGAALWTGVLAPSYAPDVNVVGVAALAPASDLPALFDAGAGTVFGKIVSAYLAHAYEAAYPETRAFSYVEPAARWLVRDIAGRCTIGRETLFSAAETMLLPREGIFWRAPSEGPFGARLAENTPRLPIAAPLLIAQGDRDDLVPAAIQTTYADAQCAEGQKLDYRVYAGRDHMSLLAPDSPLTGDLIAWTRARFAGEPAASTCPKRNGGR